MKEKDLYLVIIISVICNIFLCTIKTIIGVISNSQAMIADGFHSLEDVSSSIISLIGSKMASKNNKKIYPFGTKRVKYIFSLMVSILMIMISITMLKNVILNFFEHEIYIFNIYSLIVYFITIVVKLVLYSYCKGEYKKTCNILIKSLMYDHRNDMIISLGVVISIIVTKYNLYIVDYIVSIAISLIIAYTGIKIYLESYNILMCKNIKNINIERYFKIIGYENIDIINLGENYIVILNVDKDLETNLSNIYNSKILKEYNVTHLCIKYM